MSESRQQRRARERAATKTATRPGPRTPPQSQRRAEVLEVELDRIEAEDEWDEVGWAAEWGLRGSSSGTEHNSEDLQEVVDAVVEEARALNDRYDLRIDWTLSGDKPDNKTLADAVAETGVTLPERP